MRRVVITGFGMVSPLGISSKSSWDNVVAGRSGIRQTPYFDITGFAAKISGSLPEDFKVTDHLEAREIRKMDLFIQYGMIATNEAVMHSGIMEHQNPKTLSRTGVIIGSGIGGLNVIEQTSVAFHKNNSKVSPFFIPSSLINLTSGHVAIKYGFSGPNHSIATACTTGAHAIGDGARIIKYGDADVMIAGSSEAAITPIGVAGFAGAKALSTKFNTDPKKASRPWDIDRDGFVMSEGAGIVVLEELEHAKKRGAQIYGEILGYGMSADAYHITSPHPEGKGAIAAMTRALQDAGVNPEQVDYINAHGTSTKIGDQIELSAVQSLFYEANPKIMMSSTKSCTGHLLGAAGSIEIIFTILAMQNSIAPPTINLDNPEPGIVIDLVPNCAKENDIKIAMSNSFGFGGTNASIILGRSCY
jgi:3-oxoacyl-[acyl-carrier-protein] synthase II